MSEYKPLRLRDDANGHGTESGVFGLNSEAFSRAVRDVFEITVEIRSSRLARMLCLLQIKHKVILEFLWHQKLA